VNHGNEPSQAALERSSQDAYDVVRLTRNRAAVWTVDDVAHIIDFYLILYLRYDTRSYFNVCSKADISQLNLPYETNN